MKETALISYSFKLLFCHMLDLFDCGFEEGADGVTTVWSMRNPQIRETVITKRMAPAKARGVSR